MSKTKTIKLPQCVWVDTFCLRWYDPKETITYESDEELLKDINPFGVIKHSVHNKQLHTNAYVTFKYVNGDKRVLFFNSNSEAENII